eukprot:2229866-Pyramimonas_sp.AAC.1
MYSAGAVVLVTRGHGRSLTLKTCPVKRQGASPGTGTSVKKYNVHQAGGVNYNYCSLVIIQH